MVQVTAVAPATKERSSQGEQRARAPAWKTALKVVLIIVIVAAVIYAAKIFAPKVIEMVGAVGTTVAGAASAVTSVANTGTAATEFVSNAADATTKAIKFADKVLNKPLLPVIVKAVDGVATTITKAEDMLIFGAEPDAPPSTNVPALFKVMTFLTKPYFNLFGGSSNGEKEIRPEGAW